jgi:glyoxylase-like metal-dependent hydrolase (beta-lactamase superfamily II)
MNSESAFSTSPIETPEIAAGSKRRIGHILLENPRRVPLSLPKQRARSALAEFTASPPSAQAAVEMLIAGWPDLAAVVRRMAVVRIPTRRGELRILQTFTDNDPLARDELFRARHEITRQIGWYPLVMGAHRSALATPAARIARRVPRTPEGAWPLEIGELLSVQDLTYPYGKQGGASFLLRTTKARLILDLGFRLPSGAAGIGAALVVLSHAHNDHAGGLRQLLRLLPACTVLLSELTLLHILNDLLRQHDMQSAEDLVGRAMIVEVTRPLVFRDGGMMQWFHANHSPGAVMTLVQDARGSSFLYTGDVSLTNAYADHVLGSLERRGPTPMPASIDCVLVDGAMIGRRSQASASRAVFRKPVRRAIDSHGHLLVISDQCDVELRLFVELYDAALHGDVKEQRLRAYVGSATIDLMTEIQKLARMHAAGSFVSVRVDPGISRWWDRGKSLFESHHLYTIDSQVAGSLLYHVLSGRTVVVFLRRSMLRTGNPWPLLHGLRLLAGKADVVLVGRMTTDESTRTIREQRIITIGGRSVGFGGEVWTLRGPLWGLHSDESDLRTWLSSGLASRVRKAAVFHAPRDRLLASGWIEEEGRIVAMGPELMLRDDAVVATRRTTTDSAAATRRDLPAGDGAVDE